MKRLLALLLTLFIIIGCSVELTVFASSKEEPMEFSERIMAAREKVAQEIAEEQRIAREKAEQEEREARERERAAKEKAEQEEREAREKAQQEEKEAKRRAEAISTLYETHWSEISEYLENRVIESILAREEFVTIPFDKYIELDTYIEISGMEGWCLPITEDCLTRFCEINWFGLEVDPSLNHYKIYIPY